jgi:hypothetical protein
VVCPRPIFALRHALVAALAVCALAPVAAAAAAPVQVSADPYNAASTGQHATEVEPDSFAFGSKIVTAFQVGRFEDGGAANVGWATSPDAGVSWQHGLMPGITTAGGGPYQRVTDPAVAYDPKHNVWLVASVPLGPPPTVRGEAVVVNRSSDGIAWLAPVIAAPAPPGSDYDKSWIACDGTPASPYYGRCYLQWDDFGDAGRLKMATSTDGGMTWGIAKNTADDRTGIGGQPVAQPDGTVVVPHASSFEGEIQSFRSTDGGATWEAPTFVADIQHHMVAGDMRADPLPSVEADGGGRVYVAWEDCRFRASCGANDIVMTSSVDGVSWSSLKRLPHATGGSAEEDFVPGLGANRATSGGTAHLAVAYHYVPTTLCQPTSCKVHVGITESHNAGATWSTPIDLTGPMTPTWFAATNDGYMTGDYISTSFAGGTAHPVFALAHCPSGGKLHEAIWAARPPFGKGGPNCKPPPTPPRTLSDLKVQPFRFPATSHGPSISSAGKGKFSYRSSAAGTTHFNVGHAVQRNGSRAWVRESGEFSRHDVAGPNQFRFTGHIGGHKLKPGLYRLAVQTRDSGRKPGKVAYVRFRIVSPSAFRR